MFGAAPVREVAQMEMKLKSFWPFAVLAVLLSGIGLVLWHSLFSPRDLGVQEFRGTLMYRPGLVGIPENPPPIAWLVTVSGTHELGVRGLLSSDRTFQQKLRDLNGSQVIVCGRWTVYRNPFIQEPKPPKRRLIAVESIELNAVATAPAPPTPALRGASRSSTEPASMQNMVSTRGH